MRRLRVAPLMRASSLRCESVGEIGGEYRADRGHVRLIGFWNA